MPLQAQETYIYLALLVDVDEWGQPHLALLAGVLEECLAWRWRMRHVLAIVECGAVLLLAADHLVLRLHTVGSLADLRRIVVETVVHMLHIHHVHVAGAALDQRELLDVAGLVAVGITRVAHVVAALR